MRVHISNKVDDHKFIAGIIKRRNLDPRVMAVSDRLPLSTGPGGGERYPWGYVIFDYHERVKGTFVLVTEDKDMSEEQAQGEQPGCMGYVVPEDHPEAHECHGQTEAPEGSWEARACSWREKCLVVQQVANQIGVLPEVMLGQHKLDEVLSGAVLEQHQAQQAAAEAAKPEPETEPEPVKAEASAETPTEPVEPASEPEAPATMEASTMSKTTTSKPANGHDKFAEVKPLAVALFEGVAEQLGRPLAPSKKDAKPGELYVKDKTPSGGGNSNYMSLYAKTPAGWDRALCSVRLIPRSCTLHIQIPGTVELIGTTQGCKHLTKSFKHEDWNDGQFASVIRDVDGDKMADAIKVVSTIPKRHIIEMPALES